MEKNRKMSYNKQNQYVERLKYGKKSETGRNS